MQKRLTRSAISSPIGPITLILDGDSIVICEFADRMHRVERQLKRFYAHCDIIEGPAPKHIEAAFRAYFDGATTALNGLKTNPAGTPYQQRVWQTLRTIKAGSTDSYGALAKRLGSSARAIGQANGRNPVCLVHPCHRIIGADGTLTGYAGGVERKKWLLDHEGA